MQFAYYWKVVVILIGILKLGSSVPAPASGDGSRCTNVSCSPPIPGARCTPRYERDDGCCPVWYCNNNGVTSTIYGKSSGQSSSSSSFSSFSSGGGGMPSMNMPQMGGGGGFPSIRLPFNLNLFG